MKKFLDADHPFFANPVTRWITVFLCLGMTVFESFAGNLTWAALFGAAGVWAFYVLIYLGPSKG